MLLLPDGDPLGVDAVDAPGLRLEGVTSGYLSFRKKTDGAIKSILQP